MAVFPETDFPRVVIGVDNGVTPIDQMLVTVTRPIEEAVNTVQGLDRVWSITSRGSAEIDLFFDWNVDMFHTLELVNAALARVQTDAAAHRARLTANRLTFAAFPIMGYSLTSDTVPQTAALGDWPPTSMKPRLNRMPGRLHGGGAGRPGAGIRGAARPGQAAADRHHHSQHPGRDRPHQPDRFAGADGDNHQLVLSLVSGQVRTPEEISNIVVKTTPAGRAGPHRRRRHRRALGEARLHHRHGQREARGAAEHLPAAGRQHREGGRRRSRRDGAHPQDAAAAACELRRSTTSRKSSTTPSTACATPS